MRIISGFAGGRRLVAPGGDRTRPTSDKIRGSLFNILMALTPGARVLDLFGGTGAMALEALSRGAAHAVIVDMDRQAVEAIRKNAEAVLGEDFRTRVDIIKSDYRRAISGMKGDGFDIVFLDPPYMLKEAYGEAQRLLTERGLIAEDAVLVCERARDARLEYAAGYEIYDTRIYGETAVDFLRREK